MLKLEPAQDGIGCITDEKDQIVGQYCAPRKTANVFVSSKSDVLREIANLIDGIESDVPDSDKFDLLSPYAASVIRTQKDIEGRRG